jgi:phospholipase/carboxylesterase
MNTPLQWLPAQGDPAQLMVLLHGVGGSAQGMAPLAAQLQRAFPQAAIVAPDGFEPLDIDPSGRARQWFSISGVTEDNRPARVAEALPALADWLHQTQARLGVGPAATASFGVSQGAIMALELVQVHDGLAGRVLSFSGRYAALPDVAPALTTLHFLHGEADPVIPVQHARDAIERLADLQGDATIDIAEGVGHEINGHLLQCALHRLTSHIPHRTWAEALGAAPARPRAGQPAEDADDDSCSS